LNFTICANFCIIALIFISHGHFDHIADAVELAINSKAKIVTNFEVGSWLEKKGCENVHTMNHGGSWLFDFGMVKMVNAIHSSMLPDGAYGGNPAGFVISTDEFSFYYAGDTALTMDMKLIGEEFQLNVCVLPIGDNYTMGFREAARCSDFVNCNKVIGVHFDTFGLIKIDHNQALNYFAERGKLLLLPHIGETINL
jgi:L-ascorbate metabolism protein UlaG (beta-lactamase superfamily)